MANIFDTIPADGGAAAASPPDGNVFDHIPTGNIFDTLPAEIPVTRTNPNLISATAGGTHGGGLNLTGFSKSDLPDAEDVHDVYSDLSRPAVPLPKFTVNPDDSRAKSVFKSAANMAISLPEFAESPLGVATGGAASVIPRLVAAGFLADTGTSVADQSTQLGSQWDSMTPGQRAAAVTDLGGSTLLAAAMAHGATRMPAKDAAAIEATAKQVEKPAAPAATPANAAPNVFDIIPPEAPAEKATAPVLHPDGTVNQIETALNQLRAESKEPAPVPPAAQTNPVIGEQPPAEPPVPVTPDLAAQIQAALRGNQLAPELPRPSEPAPLPPETSHVPAAVEPAPVPAAASTESEKPNEQSNQIPQNRQVPIAENPAAGRGETVQSGPALDVSQNDAGRQRPGANAGDASNPAAVPGAVAEAKDFTRQSAETKNAPAVASETPALAQSSDLDEQHALETVQEAFGLNKAQSARLAELQKKNASGIGGSPSRSKESASTATQPQAAAPSKVARGLRARKVFDNVTQMAGPDVLSWIAENQRMMSKSEAKSTLGKEWWQRNASLYDDAAPLKSPTHNVIYGGKSRPDQVAQAAYDAHVIKSPDVSTLWDAIHTASAKRASAYENSRANDAAMQAEAQEHQNWQKATAQGEQRVTPDQLKVGDVMEVGGERVKVKEVDPDTGDVTLQDGSKFGRQVLRTGESIHVEKLDSAKYAAGDFSFDGMESDADQKARQLAEKRKADEAKAKAGMLDKAQARLTGKDLDTTREMFGADVKTDKSGQQSMFAKGDEQTDTPQFKQWFGDSKVVDKDGKPLVVYHGTKSDFTTFNRGKAGASDPGLVGKAFYFTPSGEQAGSFAENNFYGKGKSANVIPAFVRLENPLVITDGKLPDGRTLTQIHPNGITSQTGGKLQREITLAGHDGVIFKHGTGEISQVVAFDPTQIKSAIGNRGTFDPNDANILHASGNGRGLTVEAATDAINSHLGTKELPAGIKVIRDETAPWGARIEGRNKITVNAAQISTPERARAVILEEGLHGVWQHPDVQRAWQAVRDLVTPEEMRAEYLKRQAQGLPTDVDTIREEATISRLIKADANKGIFARVYQAIRTAIKRTFGIDLPAGGHEQLKEAATAFLRRDEGQEGAKGEFEIPRRNQLGQQELEGMPGQRRLFADGDKHATGEYFGVGGDDERPQRERSYQEVHAELQDAEAALKKATVRGDTKTQTQAEYQQAKALAGARYRTLRDELKLHPDRIADVMKDAARLSNEAKAARDAGDTAKAQSLESEMQGHADDLDRLPPKMVARIRDELIAKGELPKMAELAKPNAGRSLDTVTDWLRQNDIASPRKSLTDRLNIADRVAEAWHGAKTSLQVASLKAQALWKSAVESYKSPPKDDDFRHVIKSWIYSDQRTGLANHQFVRELVKKIPDADRRKALVHWLEAGGDNSELRFQADTVPEIYRKPFELAMKLTPEEKALAMKLRDDWNEKGEDAQTVGLLEGGQHVENYVPQRWKIAPQSDSDISGEKHGRAGNPFSKLDSRNPFFSFKRETPTYYDGIMAKGVPENLDIAHLVSTYDQAFHKSLSSRGMIRALQDAKAKDGLPVVKISGSARAVSNDGGRTFFVDSKARSVSDVSEDGRPYMPVNHSALRGWVMLMKDDAGNPIMVKGDMLVHPDHFKYLQNELESSGLKDVPFIGGVMKTQAFLKASKLSASAFHLMTIGEHMVSHMVNPFTNGFKIDLRQPDQTLLVRNGLELGMGQPQQSFAEGLASGHSGLFNKIPGLGDFSAKMTDWMFKDYIPTMMMKTGLHALERNRARYGDKLTPDQVAELTAHQMNAAGGLLNKRLSGADGNFWGQLGANKTVMDLNRMALMAPQFLEARLKVVGQALKPYGAEQRKMLLLQAGILYMGARVLNKLLDGDPHWHDNPFSVVHNGRAYSIRTIVGDFYHLMTDPASFAAGRLAPLAKIITEDVAMGGRDLRTGARKDLLWQTQNPVSRMAQNVATDLANWLTPIPVEGMMPGNSGKGDTAASMALSSVGVGSRKFTAAYEMRDLAANFNRNSPDARAQNFQANRDNGSFGHSAYYKLDGLLDAGQVDKAAAEYKALLTEGHTAKQIEMRYDRQAPFTGSVQREQQFRASLTPEQQNIYAKARAEQQTRAAAFKAIQKGGP